MFAYLFPPIGIRSGIAGTVLFVVNHRSADSEELARFVIHNITTENLQPFLILAEQTKEDTYNSSSGETLSYKFIDMVS
ncbi:MAG: hypothetical protein AB1351_13575 [Thermoproteota archaeon]